MGLKDWKNSLSKLLSEMGCLQLVWPEYFSRCFQAPSHRTLSLLFPCPYLFSLCLSTSGATATSDHCYQWSPYSPIYEYGLFIPDQPYPLPFIWFHLKSVFRFAFVGWKQLKLFLASQHNMLSHIKWCSPRPMVPSCLDKVLPVLWVSLHKIL